MKGIILTVFLACHLAWGASSKERPLALYAGYLTKVRCEGRLLISAVGDDLLVRLEALPKELGCGVVLKPQVESARTNLILETSTGTIRRILEIRSGRGVSVPAGSLSYQLKADER